MSARHGISKIYPNSTSKQIFEAARATYKKLGMEIYKERPIAFLCQARLENEDGLILANIIASAFGEAEMKLAVKSYDASEEKVIALADKIESSMDEILSAS